mgnify:CR=1 FL=1|nr:hypothetical protein [uncultured Mediterranean phage uvMED]|tara:strand:- start:3905 stop:4009 length:105 start_codon:yes stop_codon:yes gene_type:complete
MKYEIYYFIIWAVSIILYAAFLIEIIRRINNKNE